MGEFSSPMYFGLNDECKNFPHHDPGCSKIGGSGPSLNNTPNHYRVSVPLLISSHIAMIGFHVKNQCGYADTRKSISYFFVNYLKGSNC